MLVLISVKTGLYLRPWAFFLIYFFIVVPVLISVKTGLYLGPWAIVVIDLRVEIALHDIFLVVPIVCACPTAWGIGNLHQAAAVEKEPYPSAVGSMSPGVVDLVEEEAFDRFRRLVSVEASCAQKRAPLPPR